MAGDVIGGEAGAAIKDTGSKVGTATKESGKVAGGAARKGSKAVGASMEATYETGVKVKKGVVKGVMSVMRVK